MSSGKPPTRSVSRFNAASPLSERNGFISLPSQQKSIYAASLEILTAQNTSARWITSIAWTMTGKRSKSKARKIEGENYDR